MIQTGARIVDRPRLQEAIAAAKTNGQRIVFANGCFDVLHVGHVRYLEAAKALGDLLIVAINSDEQARRLKGAGRPLILRHQWPIFALLFAHLFI